MLIADFNGHLRTPGGVDISDYVVRHEFRMGMDGKSLVYAEFFAVPQEAYFGTIDRPYGPKRVIIAPPDDIIVPAAGMVRLKPLCHSINVSLSRGDHHLDSDSPIEPLPPERRMYEVRIVAEVVCDPGTMASSVRDKQSPPSEPSDSPIQHDPSTPPADPEVGEPHMMPDDDFEFGLEPLFPS